MMDDDDRIFDGGKSQQARNELVTAMTSKPTETELLPEREFEYCPTCGGDLDTGWECTKCGLDWRDWALTPPTIEVEGEQ